LNRFIVVAALLFGANAALAEDPGAQSSRKLVNRVTPAYPPLAKQVHAQGSVRLLAVVQPDGHVKSVDVRGGNPVLVDAAVSAVKQWKYEPSAHETDETIEMRFNPE